MSEHQGKISSRKLIAFKATLREYFGQKMALHQFIAWLAFDGGRMIATSGLCFYAVPPTATNISGQIAYIMNMFTLPEYRGQGIARRLLIKTLKEARKLGYRKIVLHASTVGEHLYRSCGFKEPSDIELELYNG